MHLLILNGPNLNLLGRREPEVYGREDFESFFRGLVKRFPDHRLSYFQSNHEGYLIDKLHEAGFGEGGIIFNPGGFTHTSVALADAVRAIEAPVIEVHLSNVFAREAFRHHSLIAPACVGSIAGLGLQGYALAIQYFATLRS